MEMDRGPYMNKGQPPDFSNISPNPAVITAQPVIQTTTVVQQQAAVVDWSSGLCECYKDIKSCCCVLCCCHNYFGALAVRMNENCCVGCSGEGAGCVPGGHMAMRSRFRGTHNIPGSICGDCCVMNSFMKPCGMCQLAREMDHLGYASTC